MFDLQRFADDIPQELAGISEDVARNIMSKAAQTSEPQKNSDGSPVDANDPENVKVSYSRFKETLDRKNEFERELAAYRERYGSLNAQPQQNYQQPPQDSYQQIQQQNYQQAPQQQPPAQQSAPPIQNLTEDMIKNFEDAITFGAKQLSGFSDEQVDELNYLDDDDPRIKQWEFAKKIAENAVYANYLTAQANRQQEMQRRAYMQNQSVSAFNDYVTRQQAADNFAAVQQFAANDFFNQQSDLDKMAISDARYRIENNISTPSDFMVIRDFFTRAKAAYDSRNNSAPKFNLNAAPQFPRTDKINGIPGSGGGVTNASLAEMMKTVPWAQMPQEYKQILLQ
ncbi:MAG: hypothetical protein IJ685_03885 [Selenomonadaceae bacterium]|nr:hypothetical protein [Selenomonadaceae bacterium]